MEETLGKRISQNRKQLGLTQDQLAERLGVTAQAVSKWENDQSCPDITMLPKLAEIFGTTTDALLGHETPPVCNTQVVETAQEQDDDNEDSFVFQWDGGRKSGIGFAVLVLAVGVLMLLSGLLHWDAGFWDILWPTALLVFGLFGLFPRFSLFRLGCALFGTYFLLFNLGLLPFALTTGVLLPTLIIFLGLSLLVDSLKKPKKPTFHFHTNGHKNKSDFKADNEEFTFHGSFGEAEQFVELPRLSAGEVSISFGDFTLDLSGVQAVSSDCTVSLSCSFGELTLLVPRCYQVQTQNHTAFAQIQTSGHPSDAPTGVIHVDASASFGEIHIKYV